MEMTLTALLAPNATALVAIYPRVSQCVLVLAVAFPVCDNCSVDDDVDDNDCVIQCHH